MDAMHQRGIIVEEEVPNPEQKELGISLDAQVDRYLAGYETEAKTVPVGETKNWDDLVRNLLTEAPGDEDPEGGEAPPPGDEAPEEAPEEDMTAVPPPPTKMSLDDIDVEAFTNGVVRMINNIDSLLEVRSTIVRRAASFLSKDYDDQVLKATMESFKEMHGIVPGKTRREVEGEDFQAPRAGEAGPAGGM